MARAVVEVMETEAEMEAVEVGVVQEVGAVEKGDGGARRVRVRVTREGGEVRRNLPVGAQEVRRGAG